MSKLEKLKEVLRSYGKVVVAFSGGVDSTFLMKVAHDELGDDAIALTSKSLLNPEQEFLAAKEWCESEGIRQVVLEADELTVPGFVENPPERCYICKSALFSELKQVAEIEHPGAVVVDGSNMDDKGDYRPGAKALKELDVKSPLQEANLTKAEIRAYSKELGVPTWNKPSFACLASRFPYGERITAEALARVAEAEMFLRERGFGQLRMRSHGDMARIEVQPEKLADAVAQAEAISKKLHELGFSYVSLDLDGYRTGSMNEVL